MANYTVKKRFVDLQDNRRNYQTGEDFPSVDSAVLEFKPERIELLVDKGFIEEVKELKEYKNEELRLMLDEKGIEYDPKATKEVLINLLTDSE